MQIVTTNNHSEPDVEEAIEKHHSNKDKDWPKTIIQIITMIGKKWKKYGANRPSNFHHRPLTAR